MDWLSFLMSDASSSPAVASEERMESSLGQRTFLVPGRALKPSGRDIYLQSPPLAPSRPDKLDGRRVSSSPAGQFRLQQPRLLQKPPSYVKLCNWSTSSVVLDSLNSVLDTYLTLSRVVFCQSVMNYLVTVLQVARYYERMPVSALPATPAARPGVRVGNGLS